MDRPKKIAIVKTATTLVVGRCVSSVITTVLTNNLDTPEGRKQELELKVASWAIGGMVASAARTYTDKRIDGIVKMHDKIQDRIKNAPKK